MVTPHSGVILGYSGSMGYISIVDSNPPFLLGLTHDTLGFQSFSVLFRFSQALAPSERDNGFDIEGGSAHVRPSGLEELRRKGLRQRSGKRCPY